MVDVRSAGRGGGGDRCPLRLLYPLTVREGQGGKWTFFKKL
ncbi:hypothetical protein HMPREF0262_01553 [Clostridium sp. ATCC 29733]|nr:hypothetical protein HMPREF0262_01553 [Clostridium sp. ATCC 29733]